MTTEALLGLKLRQPPANVEAEQALLGALLANNRTFDRVGDFLKAEHFAHPAHGRIYTAIARRIEAGHVVTAVALKNDLEGSGALEECGGTAYLAQLVAAHVGTVNAAEYARVVHDCWVRRQLIELGESIVNGAFEDGERDAPELVEAGEEALFALAQHGRGATAQPVAAGDAVAAAIAAAEEASRHPGGVVGVTTGFAALDRMTGGLRAGEMTVLAARPSMGKTALCLGIAGRAAAAGNRVLVVSREMVAAALGARLAAAIAGMDLSALTRGRLPDADGSFRALTQAEWQRLMEAERAARKLPLLIEDSSAGTVAAIRSVVRREMRRGVLDLVVVDYLGLMRPSAHAQRNGNKNVQIGEIAADMKELALHFQIPVLVLAQLNRGVEGREDKRPGLSDLRDSGEVEQHADAVAFLYREHYYLTRSRPMKKPGEDAAKFQQREDDWFAAVERERGRAEVIIAKQRQGAIGPVRLRFADHLTWFFDESEAGDPPPALGAQGRLG